MVRVLAQAVLAFVVAAILAYVATLAGGILLGEWLKISQREGAYAMGLAFFYAPAIALLVGIIAAVAFGARAARKGAG